MNRSQYEVTAVTSARSLATNKVLINTYTLLSATLFFSFCMTLVSVYSNAPHPGLLMFFLGAYGLMFLVHALRNTAWGLLAIFAFTGFMGYTLGPLLNFYLSLYTNANVIIAMSLGATAVMFLSLSLHALMSKADYSYLNGFLFAGCIIAMVAVFAGIMFPMPALHLATSALFTLIASGLILFQTSQIIQGGERNYIMATISLYLSIYNLFVSLLHLFSAFTGRSD